MVSFLTVSSCSLSNLGSGGGGLEEKKRWCQSRETAGLGAGPGDQ